MILYKDNEYVTFELFDGTSATLTVSEYENFVKKNPEYQ